MTQTDSDKILIDDIRALAQGILSTIRGKGPVPQIVREAQLLEAQLRAAQSEDMRRLALSKLNKLKRDLEEFRARSD